MNVIEGCFIEIIKSILTMTLTGSIVSIFLFAIKPIIKDKLPKSFQYYMWFSVIIALTVPLSQIAAIPTLSSQATSMQSMYDIAQWISDTAFEKSVNFVSVPQAGNEQKILQTTAHSPSIAMIFFVFWQFGVILVLGFHIICYVRYARRLKKYNISADPQEMKLLKELSGSRNTPQLYKKFVSDDPYFDWCFPA